MHAKHALVDFDGEVYITRQGQMTQGVLKGMRQCRGAERNGSRGGDVVNEQQMLGVCSWGA